MATHNTDNTILTGCRLAIALLCFMSLSFNVFASFTAPDFAFPATVREEAEKELKRSLESRDYVTALYAANEITAANSLTYPDSIGASLANYNRIAGSGDVVYGALANLLKARILTDFYLSRRYIFDRRQLPSEPVDEEPGLWSGNQFKEQISGLLKNVLREKDSLRKVDLQNINILLTDAAEIQNKDLTLWDFAIYRIVNLSQKLNLKDEELQPVTLINDLIESDEDKGEDSYSLYVARIEKLNYIPTQSERVAYGVAMLGRYPTGSYYRPQLVVALCNSDAIPDESDGEKVARYGLLERTLNDSPDSGCAGKIRNMMAEMKQPSVYFDIDEQWLSDIRHTINVTSSNMEGKHLLLIPISAGQADGGVKLNSVVPVGKIIDCGVIHSTSEPYTVTDTLQVPGLKAGYYALTISSDSQISGVEPTLKNQYVKIVNVSDLSVFWITGLNKGDKNPEIYVIDSRTGNPVSGAKVTVIPHGKGKSKVTLTTGHEGMVSSPYEYGNVVVTHKGSRLKEYFYSNGYYSGNSKEFTADIFTDLALYHPGDTINCAVVVSRINKNLLSPENGKSIVLNLYDPNGKIVDSKSVVTEDMGRTTVKFLIPADGLTGQFRISAGINGSNAGRDIGSTYINVADYHAPSFIVNLSEPVLKNDADYAARDIEIEGTVITYSGMPMADSEVKIDLVYSQPYWRWMSSNNSEEYGAKVSTDRNGKFHLDVDAEKFKSLANNYGVVVITATATSPDGETQSSPQKRISLGEGYTLEVSVPEKIEITGDSITLGAKVKDILGLPIKKKVTYEISRLSDNKNGDDVSHNIDSGEFESPLLTLPTALLTSGRYEIKFILPDSVSEKSETGEMVAHSDTVTRKMVVWRKSDKVPPVRTPLWVPVTRMYASPGDKTISVTVGNSYNNSKVFCLISNSNGDIETQWLSPKGENLNLKVQTPHPGEIVRINLFAMNDLKSERDVIEIFPAESNIKPYFEVVTFRDRLVPGGKEEWKFRFMEDKAGVYAAVMAVMSNKSLNAITPFDWRFDPQRWLSQSTPGNINNIYIGNLYFNFRKPLVPVKEMCKDIVIPDWQLWSNRSRNIRIRGSKMYMKSLATAESASDTGIVNLSDTIDEVYDSNAMLQEVAVEYTPTMAAIKEEAEADGGVEAGVVNDASDMPEMHASEMPLAFFKPDLSTDKDGFVEVGFTVPNFNTTWVLQLLGYDATMRSTVLKLDAVASKPVMVSGNIPSYLLTGDKCIISANIYNNTDEELDIKGKIEIVDPVTGGVLAFSEDTFDMIEPSGSHLLELTLDTPTNLSSLLIRMTASSEKGSDGEQTLIPVYPSSQPVMDSYTFYLTEKKDYVEISLPNLNKDSSVTLNYCGNPAWYVLTSLSGLYNPDSESALVVSDALFSNSLANAIISGNPAIKAGLRSMLENRSDNTLLSPLEKNRSLKFSSTNNTPWVNNAENETERMASLAEYLEPSKANGAIERLTNKLITLQGDAGGWRWMKQMPESEYITVSVLNRLGKLNSLGCLPETAQLRAAMLAALQYADKQTAKSYKEWITKSSTPYPLSSEIRYFMMREQLTGEPGKIRLKVQIPTDSPLRKMERDLYSRLPKEWKTLNLSGKIEAATLLNRKGDLQLAKSIMSSVLQFASYKESKGMWFEANDLYGNATSISLVASCVDALKEIDPMNPAIDKLLQYLVLSRQTQNWSETGNGADITSAVSAVIRNMDLTSNQGTESSPDIYIGGEKIDIPVSKSITGDLYVNLTAAEVSGKTLRIRMGEGSLAWGGIGVQYVEDMSKVKPHNVGAIKIDKRLYPVNTDSKGRIVGKDTGKFKKGDRILVTLTVVTDRDMDYVMIQDMRSACMRPVEQLTTYRVVDGIWMLVEPGLSHTNLFITSLPSGKHQISYEVFAERDGEYSRGIAEIQSLYYPLITAHSGGAVIEVR